MRPADSHADPHAPDPIQLASGVTLIGGGPVDGAMLRLALDRAPALIAADGGADRAMALGARPDWVVGDLDSLSDDLRARLRVVKVAEQDSTDFEKALARIAAPFVIGVGFLGGRLDHTLAALSALARARGPVLLLGEEDLAFACPADLALDLPPGTRLSLFPLAPVSGRGEGLVWPVAGLDFAPAGRIGTSNAVASRPQRLCFDAGRMLVILPRAHLDAALAGLLSSWAG